MSVILKTVSELLELQNKGEVSSVQITQEYLNAIASHDSKVKAFQLVDTEGALQQAQAVDAKRKAGQPLGALAGVPVAVKDVLCIKGQPTTCSSKMLQNFRPPYDSAAVEKLRSADAVLIGKTNMDEFAMGSSTENSAYMTTRNPWDLERIPGGSSGGSAAAVAASFAPVSLGTDTGGSIRQPAALCGIVGSKPTYGRVSRYGLIAFASSLDQVGAFTHDVSDNALMLEILAGYDKRDSTSVDRSVPSYTKTLNQPIEGLRIGVPKEYFEEGLDSEVNGAIQDALKEYQKLGAKLVDVSLPHSMYAVAVYYIVATAEASSNLARYEGMHYGYRAKAKDGEKLDLIKTYSRSRVEGFGKEVQRRIMLGTFALSAGYVDAYYLKALKVRRLIKNDFDQAFSQCDVVLGPTSPSAAFKIGEKSSDPLSMYLSDIYTIACNLAGIAGMSIPCGFTKSGLPIGMQLQVPPFEEEKMFRIAKMYEGATDWHTRRPKMG